MNIKNIRQIVEENDLPKFRFKQLVQAVYKDHADSFSNISTLSKELREKIEEIHSFYSFELKKILTSKNKRSYKALLELKDGSLIETVLLKMTDDKWSVCVSSQVGCALGCRFCATGELGLTRNLDSEEITDQVLFWLGFLKRNNKPGHLTNIVYMGMGEPFNNWENVGESIKILLDENLFNFSSRHISVSTSGIVPGMKNLAKEFPQVNLAVSLISADNSVRSDLMPVNNAFSLGKLKEGIEFYLKTTNRKVFFEYIMLDGINDSNDAADKLIEFVRYFEKKHLIHVNLISYNIASGKFKSSRDDKIENFKNHLQKNRVSVTIRKSLGDEIKGACGQLAGKK